MISKEEQAHNELVRKIRKNPQRIGLAEKVIAAYDECLCYEQGKVKIGIDLGYILENGSMVLVEVKDGKNDAGHQRMQLEQTLQHLQRYLNLDYKLLGLYRTNHRLFLRYASFCLNNGNRVFIEIKKGRQKAKKRKELEHLRKFFNINYALLGAYQPGKKIKITYNYKNEPRK